MMILTHLNRYFSDGPCCVVAHRYQFWVQVGAQDRHKISWEKINVNKFQYQRAWLVEFFLQFNEVSVTYQCRASHAERRLWSNLPTEQRNSAEPLAFYPEEKIFLGTDTSVGLSYKVLVL